MNTKDIFTQNLQNHSSVRQYQILNNHSYSIQTYVGTRMWLLKTLGKGEVC